MTQAVFDIISSLSSGDEFDVEAYLGTLENDGTALSVKLFLESIRMLGFTAVERIAPPAFGVQDQTPLMGVARYGAMNANSVVDRTAMDKVRVSRAVARLTSAARRSLRQLIPLAPAREGAAPTVGAHL